MKIYACLNSFQHFYFRMEKLIVVYHLIAVLAVVGILPSVELLVVLLSDAPHSDSIVSHVQHQQIQQMVTKVQTCPFQRIFSRFSSIRSIYLHWRWLSIGFSLWINNSLFAHDRRQGRKNRGWMKNVRSKKEEKREKLFHPRSLAFFSRLSIGKLLPRSNFSRVCYHWESSRNQLFCFFFSTTRHLMLLNRDSGQQLLFSRKISHQNSHTQLHRRNLMWKRCRRGVKSEAVHR